MHSTARGGGTCRVGHGRRLRLILHLLQPQLLLLLSLLLSFLDEVCALLRSSHRARLHLLLFALLLLLGEAVFHLDRVLSLRLTFLPFALELGCVRKRNTLHNTLEKGHTEER